MVKVSQVADFRKPVEFDRFKALHTMAKKKIEVEGLSITINQDGYISLTDIAKRSTEVKPAFSITNWLRNQSTLSFLMEWEKFHNPDFNVGHIPYFKEMAGDNRKAVNPQRYIDEMQAIGITSKAGRYGGTFAHQDIALNFCYWLSPTFQVYLIKEFQRLKEDESQRLNLEWNIRRELAKAHYPLLKEAVLNSLPPEENKASFYLADEADLINKIVFGVTAKEWRAKNPNTGSQNMRDFATVEQLLLVSDLEVVDSLLIKWDCDKEMRTEILEKFAGDLRRHFKDSASVQRIKDIQDRSLK